MAQTRGQSRASVRPAFGQAQRASIPAGGSHPQGHRHPLPRPRVLARRRRLAGDPRPGLRLSLRHHRRDRGRPLAGSDEALRRGAPRERARVDVGSARGLRPVAAAGAAPRGDRRRLLGCPRAARRASAHALVAAGAPAALRRDAPGASVAPSPHAMPASISRRTLLGTAASLVIAPALPRLALAAEPVRLVVAADSEPRQLNPAIVASNGVFFVASKVVEPLAEASYYAGGPRPLLATGWKGLGRRAFDHVHPALRRPLA
jgi:hypothetical protein